MKKEKLLKYQNHILYKYKNEYVYVDKLIGVEEKFFNLIIFLEQYGDIFPNILKPRFSDLIMAARHTHSINYFSVFIEKMQLYKNLIFFSANNIKHITKDFFIEWHMFSSFTFYRNKLYPSFGNIIKILKYYIKGYNKPLYVIYKPAPQENLPFYYYPLSFKYKPKQLIYNKIFRG